MFHCFMKGKVQVKKLNVILIFKLIDGEMLKVKDCMSQQNDGSVDTVSGFSSFLD